MTITELIAHLQRLESEGHGDRKVVIGVGYDSDCQIMVDPPQLDSESYVWDRNRLIQDEDTYLIFY